MALATFGDIITSLSGKIGGFVFSHNRSGAYVRLKGPVVHPGTPRQNTVTTLMANLTALWINLLTEVQRLAWSAYAQQVAMTNRQGRTIYLTGQNHYVRSNLARLQAGLARVDDGPTDYALPATDPTVQFVASAGTDELSISFDEELPWVDQSGGGLIVLGGEPRAQTRKFFKGPYRLAGFIAGDDTTPPTSPMALDSDFPLAVDQLITIQLRISTADGRLSAPFLSTDIVGA